MKFAASIPALLAALSSPITMAEKPVADTRMLEGTQGLAFVMLSSGHPEDTSSFHKVRTGDLRLVLRFLFLFRLVILGIMLTLHLLLACCEGLIILYDLPNFS